MIDFYYTEYESNSFSYEAIRITSKLNAIAALIFFSFKTISYFERSLISKITKSEES